MGKESENYNEFACIGKHGSEINDNIINKIRNFISNTWNKIKDFLTGNSFKAVETTATAGVRG